jgi:hypothetical protein
MGTWTARLAHLRTHEIADKTDKTPVAPSPEGVLSVLSVVSGGEESPTPADATDPFVAWRRQNAEKLAALARVGGDDPGGFCAEHGRCLSYPEQKRGACSWCVPVDPEHEPEYWASHWRRFTERS